jgi:uncharacterized membrane protein
MKTISGDPSMKTAMRTISHPCNSSSENLERAAYVIAGTFIAYFGLRKRSIWAVGMGLAGADLVRRGALGTGLLGPRSWTRIDGAITIDKPRSEIYSFWRDFSNIPQVFQQLRSVKSTGPLTSHWTASLPQGRRLEWDVEVTRDEENNLIEWESMPGARLRHSGSVHFEDAPSGRGTVVRMALQYKLPGGKTLGSIAKALGANPNMLVTETLRRLKSLLEAGQIATTTGQATGKIPESHEKRDEERKVQHASENSFPASDAPAYQ